MKKEMLINVLQPEEIRIAILEDGVLEELYVERTSHESYVGNIYKGRIVNIEPSIQAAFVDFGVGRNGFLHVSDVEPAYYRHLEEDRGGRVERRGRDRGRGEKDRGGRSGGGRSGGGRRREEPRRNYSEMLQEIEEGILETPVANLADDAQDFGPADDRTQAPRDEPLDQYIEEFDDLSTDYEERVADGAGDEGAGDEGASDEFATGSDRDDAGSARMSEAPTETPRPFGAQFAPDGEGPEESQADDGGADESDEANDEPAKAPVAEEDGPASKGKGGRRRGGRGRGRGRRTKDKKGDDGADAGPEKGAAEAAPAQEPAPKPEGGSESGPPRDWPRLMEAAEHRTDEGDERTERLESRRPPISDEELSFSMARPDSPAPQRPPARDSDDSGHEEPRRFAERPAPEPQDFEDRDRKEYGASDDDVHGDDVRGDDVRGDDRRGREQDVDEDVAPPARSPFVDEPYERGPAGELPPGFQEDVEDRGPPRRDDRRDDRGPPPRGDRGDRGDRGGRGDRRGGRGGRNDERGRGDDRGRGGRDDRGRDNRGRDDRARDDRGRDDRPRDGRGRDDRGGRAARPNDRRGPSGGRPSFGRPKPLIQDVFKRGQEVLVQVIKEGMGTKGPTLSTYISIAGRYLVLMPGLNRIGVSRKIIDEEARRRLREIMHELEPPKGLGFIIRTAGLDRNRKELQRDLVYLARLWRVVVRRIKKQKSPCEIYQESDMITRTIRDIFTSDIETIWVDEKTAYEHAKEFLEIVMPRYAERIKFYDSTEPMFHRYGIESEIARIQQRHVPLPHGGSIVIDQTEALVAIDVNSGNFRADNNAEETAYQMNLQAAKEIARQLRLRDLGGVIVNDFIDMRDEKHRRNVERALRDAVRRDRARTKVLKISAFGIIEMTRQRIRPSLKRSVYQDCPHCLGTGQIKTCESMSIDVMRFVQLAAHREAIQRIEIRVHDDVANYLLNRKRKELAQIEAQGEKQVFVRSQIGVSPEFLEFVCFDANNNEVKFLPFEEPAPPPRQIRGRR